MVTRQEDDYTNGYLLGYAFFTEHYKMIAIDLSKLQSFHASPKSIQESDFTGNLDLN